MNYSEVFMRIRQLIRFFLKKRYPPPPCRFAWKLEGMLTKLIVRVFRSSVLLGEIFVSFWKFQPSSRKSTKFCFRILWTWSNWQTCLGWYCNPQLLQPRLPTIFRTSPLLLSYNDVITKNFSAIYSKEKSLGNLPRIHFLKIIMQTFSVKIPSWMGF
jgi:hypothetical protein